MGQTAADSQLIWQLLPKIKQLISDADGLMWNSQYQSATANGRGSQTILSAKIQGTQIWLKCLSSGISQNSWGGKSYALEVSSQSGPAMRVADQAEDSEIAHLYTLAHTAYESALKAKDRLLEKRRLEVKTQILKFLGEELPERIKDRLGEWHAHKDGPRTVLAAVLEGYECALVHEVSVYFGEEFANLKLIGRKRVGEEMVNAQVEGEAVNELLSSLKKFYPKLFNDKVPLTENAKKR